MATYLLLTGAAGFIAAKVGEQLHAQGHAVVGVDNLNDCCASGLSCTASAPWRGRRGVSMPHAANVGPAGGSSCLRQLYENS